MNPGEKEEYQHSRRYFVGIPRGARTSQTRSFVWLSVTIFTISFFLIVAIRPTLVTITKLNREIKDKTVANQQLQKKIDTLIVAQEVYAKNSENLALLDEAFPEKSEFPLLAYFFEQAATASGVTLKSLSFERIGGTAPKEQNTSSSSGQSLNFTLAVGGDYLKLKDLLKELESSRRILKITESSFNRVKKGEEFELQLFISGQASFGKKS